MDMVNLTIDGVQVQVPQGTTVLEAARAANINIPTLCYLKDLNAIGSCRICMVDAGGRTLQASCVLPAAEGMVVKTNTAAVREARKTNLELLLSNHNRECTTCVRSGSCELQKLSTDLGVDEVRFEGAKAEHPMDTSSVIVRDPSKCILCRRCVAACNSLQKCGVIGATGRGFQTIVEAPWDKSLSEVACINCGQCINVCPVGALSERSEIDGVWNALNDPDTYVVVQTAPAVRVGIGEEFGFPMGENLTGKMVAALRRMGFDKVFDTDFGADVTIVEEATELVNRIKNNGKLPMFTSCSPGWVKYLEHHAPDMIDNLSTCKSPHQMLGALVKSYFAEKNGIDPKKIFVVSVMPCTAKKFERTRPDMSHDNMDDVDAVLTIREFARMIRQSGIDFAKLPDEQFDSLMGESSGAAVIFGATGGVMEAALRTAYEMITGETLEALDFNQVRGIQGIKEATIKIGDLDVNVAVASGTANALALIEKIKSGEKNYHFIEVMACPGGCVNGGGQPIRTALERIEADQRVERAKGLYGEDKEKKLRKSHENPELTEMYKEFFGDEFGGHKAHELLHVHGYVERELQ